MLIQIDLVTKNPREFGGKQIWGVKLPNGQWLNLEAGFRPEKGMQLDVNIKDVKGKDGKTYHNATIIGPAPGQLNEVFHPQQRQQNSEPQWPDPAKVIEQSKPSNYQPPAKISWSDWVATAQSACELANLMSLENDARAAFINTTMIALSNGKLELPTDAGPALVDEPGDAKTDDVPW
jgi:hypothetical protein